MSMHDRSEPVYMIGVVVNLTQMHAQTIRLYEKLGLVTPQRKNKNRLYSESDVDRLRQIRRFTQEMGVNLAGVEVILELLHRLEEMQSERDALARRSEEIEQRVRDYLAQTGGKFPWLDQMEPLPPGRPPLDVLVAMEQIEIRRIGPPPIILAPPPRQLTAAPTAKKRAPRKPKTTPKNGDA